MSTPDPIRALLAEMADELDHNRQCLLDDRSLTHPLADRARAALAAVPEGEVGELVAKLRRLAPHNPLGTADPTITRAAELLQRQHPTPVPVSERPWERKGWCDKQGRCWCLSTLDGLPHRWWLVRPEPLSHGFVLPAHALPLPQGEVEA